MCIQDGLYQEFLNHWHKWRLRYINNHANSLTRVSAEKLNAKYIFSPDIVILYYLMDNKFIHMPKILHFPVIVTLLKNISSLPKWLYVIYCCSECPVDFVAGAEMNVD